MIFILYFQQFKQISQVDISEKEAEAISQLIEGEFKRYRRQKRGNEPNLRPYELLERKQNISLQNNHLDLVREQKSIEKQNSSKNNQNEGSINISFVKNSPESLLKNNKGLSFGHLANFNPKNNQTKVAQNYYKLLQHLRCENLQEALLKANKINQAEKFLLRVKGMTERCLPGENDINLNQSWRIIKQAVFNDQLSKNRQRKN